jgi:hypothetical protein
MKLKSDKLKGNLQQPESTKYKQLAVNLSITKLRFLILAVVFFSVSTNYLSGQDELLKFSILGGTNICNKMVTPTFGVLASLRINEPIHLETGYIRDKFLEKDVTSLLTVKNKINYRTVPLHIAYSLQRFEFFAGPSFHFVRDGLLELEKKAESYDGTYTYLFDDRETTENYRTLFCSLNCGIRYYISPYLGLSASYSYGFTNRYKNPVYDTPFHAFKTNLFLQFSLNDILY